MPRDVFYEDILRPLFFQLDPEDAHDLVQKCLRSGKGIWSLLPYKYDGEDLSTEFLGCRFHNPVGLAAGFDKNARLVNAVSSLGFGFAEVGSITARATAGNPRPRLFRVPEDQALINRMGLNGDGAQVVAERLANARQALPIGVNIAKTNDASIVGDKAVQDILTSFRAVKNLRLAYIALNASCPNTDEGIMQQKQELETIIQEMQKLNASNIPLLIKVSPDSSEKLIGEIIEIGQSHHVQGYVCGNTTTSRDGLRTSKAVIDAFGNGGLSGAPLKVKALSLCKKVAQQKSRDQVIIAVGGISSGQDAYEFIRCGASVVEVYTALVYKGPSLVRQICTDLSNLLKRDRLTLKQASGLDVR